ncbi:hypothetical protein R1flu_004167 [Riccia fluitans]|uniref:Protein unc-45 homolog B n=1 Tax=Riccia fluitans TaxID=41844 RepID=A0ABD1YPH5_9MARC
MKYLAMKEALPDSNNVDDKDMVHRSMKAVGARLRKDGISSRDHGCKVMQGSNRTPFLVALKEKGHAALKKGKLQLAENLYTQAILHEKISPALLSHRANVYLKLQKYGKAVEDCTKIIDLQPNFWKAYAVRAEAFRHEGKFDQAIADLGQAKKLHPRKANIYDKLRLKCKREVDIMHNSLKISQLIEEAKKLPRRPYVKGDRRFTLAQHILRMKDCLSTLNMVLTEPGHGAIIWEQDQLDRWKKKRMSNLVGGKKKEKSPLDHDLLIIVSRLEDLYSTVKEVGIEGCHTVALGNGFPILLAVYDFHEELVLKVISKVCRYGDECILKAFLHAEPFPTLLCGLQSESESVKRYSLQLLDLAATLKPQKVLSLLIKEKLFHVILKSMHSGLVSVQQRMSDSSVSLFFKLVLDPRLTRHLLSQNFLSEDLCLGLSQACKADRAVTRLYGAQAITVLLEYDKSRRKITEFALVSAGTSGDDNLSFADDDESGNSIMKVFVNGGVLAAVAGLLCRESQNAPDRMDDSALSIWEDDVELTYKQIGETVDESPEFHECALRRLNLLSGYAQVAVLNTMRALDHMVEARRAVEVLEQVALWGVFISLLSSFPHHLSTLTAQVLAKLCRRDKRAIMHLSNLWPDKSSLILLELARSAKDKKDWQTHQAAMVILAALARCNSFLNVMQDPRSFTILVNLLEVGQSTTVISAGCNCLTIAVTSSVDCMELAEMHASSLVNNLLSIWCESRKAEVKFQVEELLFILMKRSNMFQEAIMVAFKSGKLTGFGFQRAASESQKSLVYKTPEAPIVRIQHTEPESQKPPVYTIPKISILRRIQEDEPPSLSHHKFAQTGINFSKVIDFLSSLTLAHKFKSCYKFADLCAGPGLLSIQLAKHFREAHCFAVSCKRAWVEHTKRIAQIESLGNLTSVLSRGLDVLPHALPSRVNVAILCLSLQQIQDLGYLFQALSSKLLPQGKLVLIDDNQFLMGKARTYGTSEGFNIVQQPRLFEHYSMVVLEKTSK